MIQTDMRKIMSERLRRKIVKRHRCDKDKHEKDRKLKSEKKIYENNR